MEKFYDNYLTKIKSVFRDKIVLWFSVISLCVPLWSLIAVFYDQSQHHYYYNDNTFFNSITAVGLLISIFPAVMWVLIYSRSNENYSTEAFIKPFKILKIFSVTLFVLFTIGSVSLLAYLLITYISAVNSPNPYTNYASVFYGVLLALYPIFIAIAFIIGLIIFFYLLLSYKFLNNINKSFKKQKKSSKKAVGGLHLSQQTAPYKNNLSCPTVSEQIFIKQKGKAYFGYNIFLAVIFGILAVFQILYAINLNPNISTTFSGRLENIILFINFGIIAIKHILEGLVAKNYFKQKEVFVIPDNTPNDILEVHNRNIYETLENIETVSKDIVCNNCGESVSEGAMFCRNCGNKLK